jgi:acyl carrier protein
MINEALNKRIAEMFSETFRLDVNDIKPCTNVYKELGADSLDILSFVASIENEFNLNINDEEVKKLYSVEKVIEFLNERNVKD